MIYSVETRAETFIKKRAPRITKDNGSSYYGLYVRKTTRKKQREKGICIRTKRTSSKTRKNGLIHIK